MLRIPCRIQCWKSGKTCSSFAEAIYFKSNTSRCSNETNYPILFILNTPGWNGIWLQGRKMWKTRKLNRGCYWPKPNRNSFTSMWHCYLRIFPLYSENGLLMKEKKWIPNMVTVIYIQIMIIQLNVIFKLAARLEITSIDWRRRDLLHVNHVYEYEFVL